MITPIDMTSPAAGAPRRAVVLLALLGCLMAQPVLAHGPEFGRFEFGRQVRVLPPRTMWVPYGGARYAYHDGYWYAPHRGSYLVVRPPYGVVVSDLPLIATAVTLAGITYWYANDVYYRAAPNGSGYEVVAPPDAGPAREPAERLYVYPNQAQSAERQAGDEYECHRWAVTQSGFDPTAQATGTGSDTSGRRDYQRARTACLEGRGYTVR